MLAGTTSCDKADRPDGRLDYALGYARLDLKATGALSVQEIALPLTNSRFSHYTLVEPLLLLFLSYPALGVYKVTFS